MKIEFHKRIGGHLQRNRFVYGAASGGAGALALRRAFAELQKQKRERESKFVGDPKDMALAMALGGYQSKPQRMSESLAKRGVSPWGDYSGKNKVVAAKARRYRKQLQQSMGQRLSDKSGFGYQGYPLYRS